MSLPGFRGIAAWPVLKAAATKYFADRMPLYAAALAYRTLFTIFPFLIFLVALLAFFHLPGLFAWLREQAALVVPGESMQLVNQAIDEVQQPQGGLLSAGIAVALWSASAGVLALFDAMNDAYDAAEARPTWKRIPLALGYTVCLAVLAVAAAALMVIGPQVAEWVAQHIGLQSFVVTLWTWLRLPVAVFLLFCLVAVVYHFAPNVRRRFSLFTPGTVIAVLVWIAASVGFALYVTRFGNYSATYGSLGAVVVLLFYFYLSASVLLFGAEINAEVEHRAPRTGDAAPVVPRANGDSVRPTRPPREAPLPQA